MRKKRNRNQKSIVASVSPTVDDSKSKQSNTETKNRQEGEEGDQVLLKHQPKKR